MLLLEYEMHERGITQTALANMAGINRVTVNRIVRGWERPSVGHAKAIADALGWPADRAAELFEEVTDVKTKDGWSRVMQ